jgi:hypothetical protein
VHSPAPEHQDLGPVEFGDAVDLIHGESHLGRLGRPDRPQFAAPGWMGAEFGEDRCGIGVCFG